MRRWAKDTFERSARTFIQVFVGFLTVDGSRVGIEDVNWTRAASVSLVAALASVCISALAMFRGDPTDASLIQRE